MTNLKNTKRALISSVLALLLCFSTLLGTTFAWFTDSVTANSNKIVTGNLDVELEYKNSDTADWTKVTADSNVFLQNTLWEPGHTEVIKLKVSNVGSLALKYQLGINVVSEVSSINKAGEDFSISDYIYFGVAEGDKSYSSAAEAIADVADNVKLIKESYSKPGVIEAEAEAQIITLVVYMPESVGNEANHAESANVPQINLGINLIATQQTVEKDSYGTDYDSNALYPVINTLSVPADTVADSVIRAGEVSVYIPAGAAAGTYELKVDNKSVTANGAFTTVAYDIELNKDGNKVSGVVYRAEIDVGPFLENVSVTHNGALIADASYDMMTGIVSFETSSFSPFTVTYGTMPVEGGMVSGDGKLVGGVFEELNPATLDPSLAEENSEYIAINYEKDGKTYYVVNERLTTVVLSASDTVYQQENMNYTVKPIGTDGSDNLYQVFSGLAANEHSTVYFLPGTYTATTILNVTSSMDIIGLGNTAEDVKIYKGSTTAKNSQLFNINGQTAEEHIQVTLRNMYLESTEYQQPPIQVIRWSKVKCYDLILNSSQNYNAFIINGKYSEKQTYLYAENCKVVGNQVADNMSSSGACFYYNNVTYKNGASIYDKNLDSNGVKTLNRAMEADDWTWD